MNDQGMAKTSDVIKACQWILDNKGKYNIRVANFSLHAGYSTNFYRDPLDQAVEKLWFNNVVVVAAAGNYGTSAGPSGVALRPGQRPVRDHGRRRRPRRRARGRTTTPWHRSRPTATRRTASTSPTWRLPAATWSARSRPARRSQPQKAANMVGTDRIQLSGTSFSAPIVAGTAASMLARHPDWYAGPGEGRADAHGTRRSQREPEGSRPRRDHGDAGRSMSTITPNPNKGSSGSSRRTARARSCSTR